MCSSGSSAGVAHARYWLHFNVMCTLPDVPCKLLHWFPLSQIHIGPTGPSTHMACTVVQRHGSCRTLSPSMLLTLCFLNPRSRPQARAYLIDFIF